MIQIQKKYHRIKRRLAHWTKKCLTIRRAEIQIRVRKFCFCKNSCECREKKLFTTKNPQSYENSRLNSTKLIAFTAFIAIKARAVRT